MIDRTILDQFKLTPEEEQTLRQNQATIATLRRVIKDLKAAGIDVSAEEAELERAERIRKGLLAKFGSQRVV
jgi:hypothetical protein